MLYQRQQNSEMHKSTKLHMGQQQPLIKISQILHSCPAFKYAIFIIQTVVPLDTVLHAEWHLKNQNPPRKRAVFIGV